MDRSTRFLLRTKMKMAGVMVIRVTPSSDSQNSGTTLSLPYTFFDTFWLKFPPTERVFFYQLTKSVSTTPCFHSVILPKLKHSLSIALLHFLPLAGQVRWDPQDPKPYITYAPGDAVSVTIAESDADMTRLSGNEPHKASDLHPLVPELPNSDHSAAIISLQVTFFPNQGFCLGVSAHHAVLDGKTTTMFLKSWAHICRQELRHDASLPEDLTPFFYRSVIQDPNGLDMKLIDFWMNSILAGSSDANNRNLKLLSEMIGGESDNVRATVELSHEHILKLRQAQSKDCRVSSFILTYAYVIYCLVKARGGAKSQPLCFGFSADYRSRLDPPVPANYFGNCVSAVSYTAKVGDFMSENGIDFAVKKLSEMVIDLTSEHVQKPVEIFESFSKHEPGTRVILISGSTRFGVYDVDFGWGKPRKVDIVSIDRTGAIALAESRDGNGGTEVGVCLKKHELEAFVAIFKQKNNSL